jgi:hypothetical protein
MSNQEVQEIRKFRNQYQFVGLNESRIILSFFRLTELANKSASYRGEWFNDVKRDLKQALECIKGEPSPKDAYIESGIIPRIRQIDKLCTKIFT